MLPGTGGLVIGPSLFIVLGIGLRCTKKFDAYHLDPKGEPKTFEPFLAKYIRAAEFIIGLATGSIVLLVGSSALHSQGRLPWFYASPLILLAWSVIFGITFMVWLIFEYEDYQHGGTHTAWKYTLSETLGFSSLLCFCFGYVWLILEVTRQP
jgi:hypothetical protein